MDEIDREYKSIMTVAKIATVFVMLLQCAIVTGAFYGLYLLLRYFGVI